MSYYTAVLNTVECSIHLNGASQRSAVNNFLIFDRCYAVLCMDAFIEHVHFYENDELNET